MCDCKGQASTSNFLPLSAHSYKALTTQKEELGTETISDGSGKEQEEHVGTDETRKRENKAKMLFRI